MATALVSRRLNLTRDQLAQFLTDQQQIRQFELLFSTVDELQVITGTDFEYQADTAAATANEALAQLSALTQVLQLLALEPRQELGTIASQNSDNINITGGLISGLDAPLPIASGGIGVTTASANQVFSGPTAGVAAAPTFRSLVVADIPALPYGTGTVTSVAALTLGTTGTDLSSTVANGTTTPVITLNVPTASASNRGALSSSDWNTFNNKQPAGTYVTSISVASTNGFAGTSSGGATPALTLSTSITGLLKGNGTAISAATAGTDYLVPSAPVTYTANFSVATTDVWIINNKSGSSCTATLPAASSYTGRILRFQNYQAQTLVSVSSNVVPLAGGAAGTAILAAVAGETCTLVSDGTNWIMTQYVPNNVLLLE